MEHSIVLAPEIVGHLGFLPVTNTMIVTWITMAVLVLISIAATWKMRAVPAGLQNFFEFIIESGLQITEDIAHTKAKVFFPWVMTFFLFIIVANWLGLFPGFATITYNHLPLFRSINSDLNVTLSLALLSAFITHFYAIKFLGLKDYLGKWFSLRMFGVFLFVGLLELVGEITKVVSLSFRLFGNIFAGEVVLSTISSLAAFVVPLPFYFLEIIVGFVQAAVFMMLTLVFMSILSEKHIED